jgi:membrane protein, antimicrobial resistance system
MTDVTPPPAPATPSAWEDMIEIFTSPSAVFARRREDPTFFVPWLILVVLMAVLYLGGWGLIEDAFRADQIRGAEKYLASHPEIPAEMAEQMRSGNGPGAGLVKYFFPIGMGIAVFIVGLMSWVSARIVGATTSFGQAFMVATYAFVPRILGSLVAILLAVMLPESMMTTAAHLSLSPAIAFDPTTTDPVLMAFLTRFDLFTLWSTVLIAIGIRVTGAVSAQKAYIAAFIVWLIAALPQVGGALMSR